MLEIQKQAGEQVQTALKCTDNVQSTKEQSGESRGKSGWYTVCAPRVMSKWNVSEVEVRSE